MLLDSLLKTEWFQETRREEWTSSKTCKKLEMAALHLYMNMYIAITIAVPPCPPRQTPSTLWSLSFDGPPNIRGNETVSVWTKQIQIPKQHISSGVTKWYAKSFVPFTRNVFVFFYRRLVVYSCSTRHIVRGKVIRYNFAFKVWFKVALAHHAVLTETHY